MTPPEEATPAVIGVPCMSGGMNSLGSSMGLNVNHNHDSAHTSIQISSPDPSSPASPSPHHHVQGTIV